MTTLEELVDNLVNEHNVDWYHSVLDTYKRDDLFKLCSIRTAPNHFVPGEAKALLHPDTLESSLNLQEVWLTPQFCFSNLDLSYLLFGTEPTGVG